MTRYMVWLGGLALLSAAAFDVLSILSRSIGVPWHGTIELSQAAILVTGALALVAATLARNHARVHLVFDRLPSQGKDAAFRISSAIVALFFAGLLAGSLWIAFDLWSAHEVSELIGVPWRWLRAFANVCLAAAMIVLLAQIAGRR